MLRWYRTLATWQHHHSNGEENPARAREGLQQALETHATDQMSGGRQGVRAPFIPSFGMFVYAVVTRSGRSAISPVKIRFEPWSHKIWYPHTDFCHGERRAHRSYCLTASTDVDGLSLPLSLPILSYSFACSKAESRGKAIAHEELPRPESW
jgi:hypothetical protein